MQLRMNRVLPTTLLAVSAPGLLLPFLTAQADPQTQAVEKFFAGRKMLITYREGSPLRGTYVFLEIHFCESGTYRSFGESRKQGDGNHEEVRHWSDRGTWRVAAERGQIGVRCLSSSGKPSFLPLRSWPSRDGGNASETSVLPQGAAQCN